MLLDFEVLYAPKNYLYYLLQHNKWVHGVKGVNINLVYSTTQQPYDRPIG